jgi:hypothetical protein
MQNRFIDHVKQHVKRSVLSRTGLAAPRSHRTRRLMRESSINTTLCISRRVVGEDAGEVLSFAVCLADWASRTTGAGAGLWQPQKDAKITTVDDIDTHK